MAINQQLYATMTFALRRDILAQLKKMYPKFGDLSRLMRWLLQQVVEGKIRPTLSK